MRVDPVFASGKNATKRHRLTRSFAGRRGISLASVVFLVAATISLIAGPAEAATLTFSATADAVNRVLL